MKPFTFKSAKIAYTSRLSSSYTEQHSPDGDSYIRRNVRGPGWVVVYRDTPLCTSVTREVARGVIRDLKRGLAGVGIQKQEGAIKP